MRQVKRRRPSHLNTSITKPKSQPQQLRHRHTKTSNQRMPSIRPTRPRLTRPTSSTTLKRQSKLQRRRPHKNPTTTQAQSRKATLQARLQTTQTITKSQTPTIRSMHSPKLQQRRRHNTHPSPTRRHQQLNANPNHTLPIQQRPQNSPPQAHKRRTPTRA